LWARSARPQKRPKLNGYGYIWLRILFWVARGARHPKDMAIFNGVALTLEASAMAKLPLAGTSFVMGQ